MLHGLQDAVATTGKESISFFKITKNVSPMEVAGKFYCLLELANLQVIDLKQIDPCGDITIMLGSRFHDL
uniref:Rad21/Rec8-like protein C-terminal eukaryotic domain-containing protein n=1 Tax=Podarcis muralis TaxID=64176 RepID=A0A670JMZ9_PODMU